MTVMKQRVLKVFLLIAVMVIMALCAMGSGSSRGKSSSSSCAICGKGPANRCTYDGEYYCSKHYADAWNYYNKK